MSEPWSPFLDDFNLLCKQDSSNQLHCSKKRRLSQNPVALDSLSAQPEPRQQDCAINLDDLAAHPGANSSSVPCHLTAELDFTSTPQPAQHALASNSLAGPFLSASHSGPLPAAPDSEPFSSAPNSGPLAAAPHTGLFVAGPAPRQPPAAPRRALPQATFQSGFKTSLNTLGPIVSPEDLLARLTARQTTGSLLRGDSGGSDLTAYIDFMAAEPAARHAQQDQSDFSGALAAAAIRPGTSSRSLGMAVAEGPGSIHADWLQSQLNQTIGHASLDD